MRMIAVALSAAAALTLPARGQPIAITVNGTPVTFDPAPIGQAGRIFVPLRGVFERLGVSVVYEAGRINATRDATTITLRVGSTDAAVDGRPRLLDDPPFVRAARTFVPLRFVAQALGTAVTYTQATRTIAITLPPPVRRRVPRLPQEH